MESMHSYKDFPNDVTRIFSNIISYYGLKAKSSSTTHVWLENSNVGLSFSMDRYDLMVLVIQNNIKPRRKFGVAQIVDYLYPNWRDSKEYEKFTHHKYGENASQTLKWYEKIISKYLSEVLKGNFSWSDILFRKDNYYIKYIDFIYENFDEKNEIRVLYENEDGNWQPKLFKYLSENKIDIK